MYNEWVLITNFDMDKLMNLLVFYNQEELNDKQVFNNRRNDLNETRVNL